MRLVITNFPVLTNRKLIYSLNLYRMFKYFNTDSKDDIDLDEWVLGFNVLLKGTLSMIPGIIFDKKKYFLGNLSEQILYCFHIYDLNEVFRKSKYFFSFSRGKKTFFSKNGLVSKKNRKYFYHFLGGGSAPKVIKITSFFGSLP